MQAVGSDQHVKAGQEGARRNRRPFVHQVEEFRRFQINEGRAQQHGRAEPTNHRVEQPLVHREYSQTARKAACQEDERLRDDARHLKQLLRRRASARVAAQDNVRREEGAE